MTQCNASIPVDLKNPGQVLACMGFLEAAQVLLGCVDAHFDWSAGPARFVLGTEADDNPFEVVLEFLARARVIEMTPVGYVEGGAADGDDGGEEETEAVDDGARDGHSRCAVSAFPSGEGDRNSLPILIDWEGRCLSVSHWAESRRGASGSWLSRDDFKLYSGNRSASRIATQMLQGVRAKPKRKQAIGDLRNRGLQQLWQEQRDALLEAPFEVLTAMGGSFNFDPRGAWTSIDAGFSPNEQKGQTIEGVAASPVVEILAAIGLEHARLDRYETRQVRYAVWAHPLPPMLARAALAGVDLKLPMRKFEFELDLSGKNKVTTFARERIQE